MQGIIDVLFSRYRGRPNCSTLADWLPIWRAEQTRLGERSPLQRGIAAASRSDRLAWAFFSGYQAAIQSAFPGAIQAGQLGALCVNESGRKITEISTLLEEGAEGWRLHGAKSWVLAQCQNVRLFVLARLRNGPVKGPGSLAMVHLPLESAGVVRGPARPQEVVPELPHAAILFDAVSVHPSQRVSGDGYADYAKPFRIREDVCVTACALAYLLAEARSASWPTTWCQRCIAGIAALESCSSLDSRDARTHIVTAGILSFAAEVIRDSEPHWKDHQCAVRDRWQRDRAILALGKEARRERTIRSWDSVGWGTETPS